MTKYRFDFSFEFETEEAVPEISLTGSLVEAERMLSMFPAPDDVDENKIQAKLSLVVLNPA